MVYRRDLVEHFAWLKGSEFYDDTIDEALVAIALTAYGHDWDLLQQGARMSAGCIVERLGLEEFVDRLRDERLL